MSISHLISNYGYYGYLAVFCLVGIESLGIPLPGETALILAGSYAGHTHRLSPWIIWAVASAGAIVGSSVGFWIGDKGGYRLVRRYGSKVRLDERKLKVGRYVFDRHGVWVIFLGRFVVVLRTYASFLAGTNRMRLRAFLSANAAGAVIWSGIYTFAAYAAGNTLGKVSGTANLVILGAAVVVLVTAFFLVRRKTSQLVDAAEAAYPGSLED
jgi:membrane protein DedA with SNARE-associated domain